MEIGLGLDPTLGLSIYEDTEASQKAALLGYESIWTPEGTGQDSYQICLMRWAATNKVVDGGLYTGIAVSPVIWRTHMAFAMAGGTVSKLTGGKFIMGLGAGSIYRPASRKTLNIPKISTLDLMREYISVVKQLVNGEKLNHDGILMSLSEAQLAIEPPPKTPIYLGALGPKMLGIAGELADGAALNWCSPDQISWSRERIKEGARIANRDSSKIKVSQYIRVCVDDDEDKARIELAKATMHYALGATVPSEREKTFGYRAHFERMGFRNELANLDEMRVKGATENELAEAFPVNILREVAYFGKADQAASEFARLSQGLDKAIVRVVSSTPGKMEGTINVIEACAPDLVRRNI